MRTFLIAAAILSISVSTSARAQANPQWVAETIAAEAGGEGAKGMRAVACTIANRARLWHKTPEQIVSQKNQYYGFTAANRHKLYRTVRSDADKLARDIMRMPDITGGAIYFRRPDEPKFRWCKTETYRYRNHIFYK